MSTTQIAQTIADQIGKPALYMLGAKDVVGGETHLQFKIRGCRTVNCIRVELMPDDTYTVQFWKLRGPHMRLVQQVPNVYVDSLRRVIEANTGLYASL